MPIPARAAATAGSARQLWLRRHCVAVTPVGTCSDHDGSPLGGVASRHGFPAGQHPYHRSSTGSRSRRLPASRRDGHDRRTGGGGMRQVEPCQATDSPGGVFSGTPIFLGVSQPLVEICIRSRAEGDSRSAANKMRRHPSRSSRRRSESTLQGASVSSDRSELRKGADPSFRTCPEPVDVELWHDFNGDEQELADRLGTGRLARRYHE
jgi:hypothetical protein